MSSRYDIELTELFEGTSDNSQTVNLEHGTSYKCQICNKQFTLRQLVYDHCHKTNLQRGRICRSCNVLLGMAKDNPMILRSAIDYLAHWYLEHARIMQQIKDERA